MQIAWVLICISRSEGSLQSSLPDDPFAHVFDAACDFLTCVTKSAMLVAYKSVLDLPWSGMGVPAIARITLHQDID